MKIVKVISLVYILFFCLANCNGEEKYKAKHTLYVRNQLGGDEQKIADFYEGMTGLSDCNIIKKEWVKSGYTAYCVSHDIEK